MIAGLLQAPPGAIDLASNTLALGAQYILTSADHLLFLFALLLLVRRRRALAWAVIAFTVAHSMTLAAATLGMVRVPAPPVAASIALSIAFLASELVLEAQGRPGLAARWPGSVAFAFGLLHGLGFADALGEADIPPHAIPIALPCFNVGIELGQLAFLFAALCLLAGLRWLPLPRIGAWRTASAYAMGGVAMCWTLQRAVQF